MPTTLRGTNPTDHRHESPLVPLGVHCRYGPLNPGTSHCRRPLEFGTQIRERLRLVGWSAGRLPAGPTWPMAELRVVTGIRPPGVEMRCTLSSVTGTTVIHQAITSVSTPTISPFGGATGPKNV